MSRADCHDDFEGDELHQQFLYSRGVDVALIKKRVPFHPASRNQGRRAAPPGKLLVVGCQIFGSIHEVKSPGTSEIGNAAKLFRKKMHIVCDSQTP